MLPDDGCFNTQPPEGGWNLSRCTIRLDRCFNTQPPEGGWLEDGFADGEIDVFQHTAA